MSSTRSTGAGILVALLSAATFATSGPFAKSLLDTGWTPGSVVFLRIAGAALLLLVPTLCALSTGAGTCSAVGGARSWPTAWSPSPCPSWPSSTPCSTSRSASRCCWSTSAWCSWSPGSASSRAACRGCRPWSASCSRWSGWHWSWTSSFGQTGVQVSGIGVMWGLIAACGLASYFLLSGHAAEEPLPPLVLAGGGLVVGAIAFAVLGAHRDPADVLRHRSRCSWRVCHSPGGRPCWSSRSWLRRRRTWPGSSRRACSAPSWRRSSGCPR